MISDAWVFYYDESMISRRLSESTLLNSCFCNSFVTCIVGWKKSKESEILDKYKSLIEPLREKDDDELKSTYFRNKDFQFGFVSVSKHKIKFLQSFLEIVDSNDVFCQVIIENKLAQLVGCALSEYMRIPGLSYIELVGSVTALILNYKPSSVVSALTTHNGSLFLNELTSFIKNLLDESTHLDFCEVLLLKDLYRVFSSYNLSMLIDDADYYWMYESPFVHLKQYLDGSEIIESVNIDGCLDDNSENDVLLDACEVFDKSVLHMVDSKSSYGIQIADMMAGIVSKLIIASNVNITNQWFNIKDIHLECYKHMFSIFNKQDSGIPFYFDMSAIVLKSLFAFIVNNFVSASCNCQDCVFREVLCEQFNQILSNLPTNEELCSLYDMSLNYAPLFMQYVEKMKFPKLDDSKFEDIASYFEAIDEFVDENRLFIDAVHFVDTGSCDVLKFDVSDIIDTVVKVTTMKKAWPPDLVFVNTNKRILVFLVPFCK